MIIEKISKILAKKKIKYFCFISICYRKKIKKNTTFNNWGLCWRLLQIKIKNAKIVKNSKTLHTFLRKSYFFYIKINKVTIYGENRSVHIVYNKMTKIKIKNSTIYIIMYHYVRPIKNSEYPNLKGLELKDFKNQINFFKSLKI